MDQDGAHLAGGCCHGFDRERVGGVGQRRLALGLVDSGECCGVDDERRLVVFDRGGNGDGVRQVGFGPIERDQLGVGRPLGSSEFGGDLSGRSEDQYAGHVAAPRRWP